MPNREDIPKIVVIGSCLVLFLLCSASSVFACQPCIIYEVNNRCSQVERVGEGDSVPNAEIRIFDAEKLKETGHELSCLATFKKGRVAQRTKSDRKGRFNLTELPPGHYFVVIRGQGQQVVQMILIPKERLKNSCSEPKVYQVSESGMVGNMCDILQAKDFF